MTWAPYYKGDGVRREFTPPDPPSWRTFPRESQPDRFQPPPGLIEAVNAALCLRRPLLIKGQAGSGKSTVIDQVAHELGLGDVLRWHVTSRSGLRDALYQYDALGRIHAQNLRSAKGDDTDRDDIADFLRLGPLGTALLPATKPRALLIDEVDKSDLDLPSDLLDVLERGEFDIPELARHPVSPVPVRTWSGDERVEVGGRVACTQFPFIVMTSNDERDFPEAFLRRCVRFEMPKPTPDHLHRIIRAHLGSAATAPGLSGEVDAFAARVERGEHLAVDQLLNAVHLLVKEDVPDRSALLRLLLRELSRG